jgi:tRNA(Arg) A34 adenosine deaminase TadA
MNNTEKLRAMLEVIRDEILPLTESVTTQGNDLLGSAVLRPDTFTSVIVGADNKMANPILHGVMDAINRFFKLPVHPPAEDLIFLSTHDPCPMCAAAIACAGFRELWVLFRREDDDDSDRFSPVGMELYKSLFGVNDIRQDNVFFTRRSLKKAVIAHPHDGELQRILGEIEHRYAVIRSHENGQSSH